MRRRGGDDEAGGLDSLLDTMTNVVGILVIVLVVTQMGVKDAVDRISKGDAVDPEKLAEMEKLLEEARDERNQLLVALQDVKPVDDTQFTKRMSLLNENLASEQQTLNQIKQQQQQENKKIEEARKKAAQAAKKIEENEQEREKVKAELEEALQKLAKLEAVLDNTPERQQLPPKVVNLPDPRPAPDGIKPAILVCAGNKIYPVNHEDFLDKARKRAEYVVKSKGLDRDPKAGIDPKKFIEEMNERKYRDDFIETEIIASGRYPRMIFRPREGGGSDVKEVEGARSRFRSLLKTLDPAKYYCRFFVLPDSYDVYVSARNVTAELGLLAGWEPVSDGWRYEANIGGSVSLGPPPPPPDPNAPKPKPRPPTKPQNVID
jgi:hypothetical protein